MPSEEELQQQRQQQAIQDSIAAAQARERGIDDPADPQTPRTDRPERTIVQDDDDVTLGAFQNASYQDTVRTVVSTPLFEAVFINLGAGPAKFTMMDYNSWDGEPMQMIRDTSRSAYSLGFLSSENYNIESNDYF
jgi:YidC/Oxa1 family membrane protein insertase